MEKGMVESLGVLTLWLRQALDMVMATILLPFDVLEAFFY